AIDPVEIAAVLQRVGPIPVQLPEAQRRQLQHEALALLIDDVLMRQFLARNAPPVNQADVDRQMATLTDSPKKQNKTLLDFYRDTNQNEAQVRAMIVERLQWAAYGDAHVTEAMVQKFYQDYRDFFEGVRVRASHIVLRVAPAAPQAERDA